ncbi:hypothetical protein RF11_01033 [Thelohanellus kitauei]|uniref:Uncharacterized protein n=1 Tax=Thelohanellus kitauei TaxID=669202 RepID=A0A0C2MM14_THEKT|nr:hypothetical protein RF11_01033 [Thelohanellus kitauei]
MQLDPGNRPVLRRKSACLYRENCRAGIGFFIIRIAVYSVADFIDSCLSGDMAFDRFLSKSRGAKFWRLVRRWFQQDDLLRFQSNVVYRVEKRITITAINIFEPWRLP